MIRVNGKERVEWRQDLTIRQLLDQTGRTEGMFTVVVGGQMVPRADYSSYTLEDGAEVNIFRISHGG